MQSRNPILTKVDSFISCAEPMTMQGAIKKSLLLLIVAAVVGLAVFLYTVFSGNTAFMMAATILGAVASIIFSVVLVFKPHQAEKIAVPFAIGEGLFLGGISAIFQSKYPGIPAQALLATFSTSLVMFGLYRYKIIKVTEKLKAIVVSASIAIFVVFLLQIFLQLIFGSSIPMLFTNSPLGIAFAVFIIVIASLNLILDFDLIETSVVGNAPKFMEWVSAVALLATLVWMYYSFLRLIGLLKE